MAAFLSLPTEILHRICYYADLTSRKSLRHSNRRLSEIAECWVFHTLSVSPLAESCERLQNVLDNPKLSSHVTKLYMVTFDIDKDDEYVYYEDAEDEDYNGEEETNLPMRFWSLFDRLRDLRLQSVVLRFHNEYSNNDWNDAPQELEFRAAVLKRAFAAFAALPHALKELAIRELHNINDEDSIALADMEKVLSHLESLRLNITNEHREFHGELDYQRAEAHEFYRELPAFWLGKLSDSLQHLTIYSSLHCGFYPKLDFSGLHFPNLKTLALNQYCFFHDSQLDWILSHSATLSELYLDDCAILYEVSIQDIEHTILPPAFFQQREGFRDNLYASYEKRWADYFRAFKGLLRLQHFRYGHSHGVWELNTTPFELEADIPIGMHDQSYLTYSGGHGSTPYTPEPVDRVQREDGWSGDSSPLTSEPVIPSEDDKAALDDLCAQLRQPLPFRYQ